MKSILMRSVLNIGRLRTNTWPVLMAAAFLCGSNRLQAASSKLDQALSAYDAAIQADATAALARLTSPVTLDGKTGAPFDFGATTGDTTMEFILQGDPTAGASAYLAVGSNTSSSLRYAQWENLHQLGFTQSGVADYTFTPAAASPPTPTHIALVWNSTDLSMTLYINGKLAATHTSVSADFAMPTGAGYLGSTAASAEVMLGTIYRVTVYFGVLPDTEIKSHADAFGNVILPVITSFTAAPSEIPSLASSVLSWQVFNSTNVFLNGVLVTGTNKTVSPPVTTTYTLVASNEVNTSTATLKLLVDPRLGVYDAAIASDATNGLVPLVTLTNKVNLTGTGGEPFDFGATSGDTTMEFILEGDPTVGTSAFLAVGENSPSNLRYAQWENTQQLGFTQGGAADYVFVPGVPSPTIATHVAYVWNAGASSMTLYVNGVNMGTVTNVNSNFAMPTGAGYLGANSSGSEAMVGRIFRVVVYAADVSAATIQKHATAFTSMLRPPIITSLAATPTEIIGQGSSVLNWQVQDATAVFLNGTDVTRLSSQTVFPAATTTYTLLASNNVSTVTAKVTVLVTPLLASYDAAIAADYAAGLVPIASLNQIVALTGSGGVPFDFGTSSGDVMMEFIIEGDPTTGASAYLAVGENTASSLRYAQYENSRKLGFTQIGIADYVFTPPVASPTSAMHVAYQWNSSDASMRLYTNGVLAGVRTNVSTDFAMPTGAGFLGSNETQGEAFVGRIFRVEAYAGTVPEATIQKHGAAFRTGSRGPSMSVAVAGSQATITVQGVSGTHYRVDYRNSLSATDTWQLLQDIPSLSGTSVQVVDPTPTTGRAQRFYRTAVAQ